MPSKSKVYFFSNGRRLPIRNKTSLKKAIESLFKKEGKGLKRVNYIFCTDDDLLKLNNQFLKHNYYTDILTFDMSMKTEEIIGEIYISLDRVRENARTFETTITRELRRVIFHGALHLCGYKDNTVKERKQMIAMENYYLSRFSA